LAGVACVDGIGVVVVVAMGGAIPSGAWGLDGSVGDCETGTAPGEHAVTTPTASRAAHERHAFFIEDIALTYTAAARRPASFVLIFRTRCPRRLHATKC
jgi:hypothetical protein